jgi:hypothetical protein
MPYGGWPFHKEEEALRLVRKEAWAKEAQMV